MNSYHFINEQQWIEDIREGNREAFKYAFNFFYANLCSYTTNLTIDPDLAEDIVQGIFISLWNNRQKTIISTSLKSYLYKSCYNRYIDIYRQNKRTIKKLEEFRYAKLIELEEENAVIQNKKIEDLNNAIQELPPRCKEIFLLSKYEGLKYQEIADKLQISIKTVENQIGFAYAKLRNILNPS
ncbi:MAG TPA: RNA polymerase sigma-70 factor [Salinimicrobium sp.]|nr:RNA polymerase sigma-70 factor [Salinimicrobium sp.]